MGKAEREGEDNAICVLFLFVCLLGEGESKESWYIGEPRRACLFLLVRLGGLCWFLIIPADHMVTVLPLQLVDHECCRSWKWV